ncbi:MAG: hypothetical protein R3D30_03510 [Hyphomicrobiales bacterium]
MIASSEQRTIDSSFLSCARGDINMLAMCLRVSSVDKQRHGGEQVTSVSPHHKSRLSVNSYKRDARDNARYSEQQKTLERVQGDIK